MIDKLTASVTAAEPLLAAAVMGIGAELYWRGSGIVVAGAGWFLLSVIDRIRRVD